MIVSKRLAPSPRLLDSVCSRCLAKLPAFRGHNYSTSNSVRITSKLAQGRAFRREYFAANSVVTLRSNEIARHPWNGYFTSDSIRPVAWSSTSVKFTEQSTSSATVEPVQGLKTQEPLDRRKRRKGREVDTSDGTIPLDASSRLSTKSATLPPTSIRRLLTTCLSLSKPRLSFLMVLTTATAYSLYPVPTLLLSSTTTSPSLSALAFVFLTAGTSLCAASANALNMLIEPEHDAKMSRTRNRPIVRGLIGKRGALIFAAIAGVLGSAGLYLGVNPTTAFLGGFTIFLYAGVYTPMKRLSVLNTWVGAVVGSIPPLMGWTAAAGQCATGTGDWQELLLGPDSLGGWLLAGLLFAWQFPHFHALSWTIREEYKNAGYRMLASTNPKMLGRVGLRYALLFFPICAGLSWAGVTDQGFLVTSSIVNAWIVREAYGFWRYEGQKGTARKLFWASVWHLPIVMVLAMVHKQGLWQRIWNSVTGQPDEEEIWEVEEEMELRQDVKTPVAMKV